jgi:hypothetical protein
VGIDAHVDEAAVNFNFWVTDDDASLNPDRNGLQVTCCHVALSVLPRAAIMIVEVIKNRPTPPLIQRGHAS